MDTTRVYQIFQPASTKEPGRGGIVFTNRYDIFDWSAYSYADRNGRFFEMPDEIKGKASSVSRMSAHTFDLLKDYDIPTHMIDFQDGRFWVLYFNEIRPDFENEEYRYPDYTMLKNWRLPIEVLVRNTISSGSSFRQRKDPIEAGLSMENWPEETVYLDTPILEITTSAEAFDRFIDWDEAECITGLNERRLREMKDMTLCVNDAITKHTEDIGMVHHDGKLEWAFNDGQFVLVAAAGTLDQNKFSANGTILGTRIMERWYEKTQPDWVAEVKSAKRISRENGEDNWYRLCEKRPNPMPEYILRLIGQMYESAANVYIGDLHTERERKKLSDALQEINSFIESS